MVREGDFQLLKFFIEVAKNETLGILLWLLEEIMTHLFPQVHRDPALARVKLVSTIFHNVCSY